jgi:predicted secreted protein
MSVKFGIDGKLYYCVAGIGGTPTWTELSGVKNVTLNVQGKEVDVTTRASAGFALADIALMDASIEFDLPLDPADTGYQAVETAFFARSLVGLAVMSGGVTVAGSRGLWADCKITQFNREESLEDAMIVKVTAKPTHSANAPLWKIVSGT